jgi:alpha-glucosidase
MMLALPGSAYIYQGEELGLPEHVFIPDEARQDPTWFRTNHERYGRDGCRVPLPWEAKAPAYGFSATGETWLPQPEEWAGLARDRQLGVPTSTLELYRSAIRLRAQHELGSGAVEWLDLGEGVLAFDNGDVRVIANISGAPVVVEGQLLAASGPVSDTIPKDTTVWLSRR